MLDQLINQRRDWILERWLERVLRDYPPEGEKFLREQGDRFANPVGHALRSELGGVIEGVLGPPSKTDVREALDRIIRIRAVQDMPPSRAVGFVFELKSLIRQAADKADAGQDQAPDLSELDDRVDRLALEAFDVYMACRDQLSSIRVNEIRNRSLKAMERLHEWQQARAEADETEPAQTE